MTTPTTIPELRAAADRYRRLHKGADPEYKGELEKSQDIYGVTVEPGPEGTRKAAYDIKRRMIVDERALIAYAVSMLLDGGGMPHGIPLPPGCSWSDEPCERKPHDEAPEGTWTTCILAPLPDAPNRLIAGRGRWAGEAWVNLAARAWHEYRAANGGVPDGFSPSRVEPGRPPLPPASTS